MNEDENRDVERQKGVSILMTAKERAEIAENADHLLHAICMARYSTLLKKSTDTGTCRSSTATLSVSDTAAIPKIKHAREYDIGASISTWARTRCLVPVDSKHPHVVAELSTSP